MKEMTKRLKSGFTLIELLIVVAIIAILAAIAVPNFLEAQTRAKVSRARADHRTIATGLEMYHIDHNKYPWCSGNNWCFATTTGGPGGSTNTPTLERLTSPISYLTGKATFYDPFKAKYYYEGPTLAQKTILVPPGSAQDKKNNSNLYWFTARNARDSQVWGQNSPQDTGTKWWFLQSAGPDAAYDLVWRMINQMVSDSPINRFNCGKTIYDATNGTISRGSIFRAGGVPTGYATSLYFMIQSSTN